VFRFERIPPVATPTTREETAESIRHSIGGEVLPVYTGSQSRVNQAVLSVKGGKLPCKEHCYPWEILSLRKGAGGVMWWFVLSFCLWAE